MEKIAQLKGLVRTLNQYRHAYYNLNTPVVTDAEYDRLYDALEKMEKETGIVLSNSPTQSVGYYPVSKLEKIRHNIPLLSLDKTKDLNSLMDFIGTKDVMLMLKLDGLTTKMVYEDGILVEASTRGDGEVGEVITHNVPAFKNVPLTIPMNGRLVVTGESIIYKDDFERLRDSIGDKDGKPYRNARNLASGSVRSLDPKKCSERQVYFIPFNVLEGIEGDSREKRLLKLTDLGFAKCLYIPIKGSELDREYLEFCIDGLKDAADQRNIPIDGVVAMYDSLSYSAQCGRTGHHYKDGIAYKFEDELFESVLRKIEWTPTRSGEIAPVGIFDTVEIDGCEVSRATLHNLTHIKNLELVPGCRILVSKRNMIIPKIEENMDRGRYVDIVPPRCPCCNGETRIRRRFAGDGKIVETVHCDNPECDSQVVRKFQHFCCKKAMNIEGISEATLQRFLDLGYLRSFQDIYHLDHYQKEIVRMDGFGYKSFERLWNAITASRNTDFSHYLVAMDIPMIGRSKSRVLNEVFRGSLEDLEAAATGNYDFTKLEDFGETLDHNLHTWFADEENLCQWRNLQKEMNFISKEEIGMGETRENPFMGRTVVATGKLENFTRDDINMKILELGGKPGSSVTKKTDYLICGEKAGSKLEKARSLGVPVLSEVQFLEMIGE